MLRLTPILGKLTLDPGSAVISHGYWTRRFASDPSVLGKTLSVNGAGVTITGIAPAHFAGVRTGDSADIWLSLLMQSQVWMMGSQNLLNSVGDNSHGARRETPLAPIRHPHCETSEDISQQREGRAD